MDERRIGLAERELAMGALDEHRRADRLDAAEYHRRSAIAARAEARAELDGLFVDLPAPRPEFTDPTSRERDIEHVPAISVDRERTAGDDDRTVDLPELVTPLAATVARHAGLLSLLTPVIAFGLFAATGFRFPFVFVLVPVAIGVLTYWSHRYGA